MSFKEIHLKSNPQKIVLEFIKSKIKGTEYENHVFIAGGYVRDEILGKQSKDIDLLVDLPNGGIAFAEWICKKIGAYKEGANPVTYPRFGTAKFNLRKVTYKGIDLSNYDIEAVMSRAEKYGDTRKPDVQFSTLQTDAERRDLTINSLLKNLSNDEIKDLTGKGILDLKNKIIRTPLDPHITFTDDPLRMLRLIRFAVKYDWNIPFYIIKSLKKNAEKINNISSERIQDELNKILLTDNPDKGIRLLQLTGLLKHISPELDATKNLGQNKYHKYDVLKHTAEVIKGVKPDIITRLSALLHDIGKVKSKEIIDGEIHFYQHEEISGELAKEILKRLKYPNEIIDAVVLAVTSHMRIKSAGDEANISDKALRKLKNDFGEHLERILDLMDSDNKSHAEKHIMPNQITTIRQRLKTLSEKDPKKMILPVNGDDIMRLFKLKPGKDIGKILAYVKDQYLENPRITKFQMLKLIKYNYKDII